MQKNLFYVGIDVDDKSFHVAVLCRISNDLQEFKCAPNITSLLKKLSKFESDRLIICYEASHLGFSLYRSLVGKGYRCDVIAPSLIPELPGKKQKTDKIDARKLAEYHMKNLLTIVHVPSFVEEMDRDLVRSRKFLAHQSAKQKNKITSFCRTLGWHYKQETGAKSYWNASHLNWLEKKVTSCDNASLKINLTILQRQLEQTLENISLYNAEIEKLAKTDKYAKKVSALNCYRGLDTNSSIAIITELGDINRFRNPSHLMSYCGFDLIEYSSGGKERKFSMSKDGNKYVRSVAIEACQYALIAPKASAALRIRRRGVDKELTNIADRCMARLYKKGTRLLFAGKERNKAKVACAREMLGFVWESLRAVS
jgi:transposase